MKSENQKGAVGTITGTNNAFVYCIQDTKRRKESQPGNERKK